MLCVRSSLETLQLAVTFSGYSLPLARGLFLYTFKSQPLDRIKIIVDTAKERFALSTHLVDVRLDCE